MTTTSLEELVRELSTLLLQNQAMLVTAESCTGGLVAATLTEFAGSSTWFERGFITYSNQAKHENLGVPLSLIAEHGAVSVQVAAAMAQGAVQHSHGQLGLAITGVAGPGGGTPEKPVGTVCFGWSDGHSQRVAHHLLTGDRQQIRQAAVRIALAGALHWLRGSP